jgi:two-component system response regulator CpxR
MGAIQAKPEGGVGAETPSGRETGSILLVDDDVSLCRLVGDFLTESGFVLQWAHDGPRGLARALDGNFDLVLLDVMLPALGGFELLRQLRRRSSVPVIMLTARGEQRDRIEGLNAGADDYLPKPFGPEELLARIQAVLRRSRHTASTRPEIVTISDLQLNLLTREVWAGDERIDVTMMEFDILDLLVRSAGRTVSRDEVCAMLYQRQATPFERALEVHISHLRKKIERAGIAIRSMRGVGYLLAKIEEVV